MKWIVGFLLLLQNVVSAQKRSFSASNDRVPQSQRNVSMSNDHGTVNPDRELHNRQGQPTLRTPMRVYTQPPFEKMNYPNCKKIIYVEKHTISDTTTHILEANGAGANGDDVTTVPALHQDKRRGQVPCNNYHKKYTTPKNGSSVGHGSNWSNAVWIYGSPMVLIGGSISNAFALVAVSMRKRWAGQLVFMVIILMDMSILYAGLFSKWTLAAGYNLRLQSSFSCKVQPFIEGTLKCIDAWMVMTFTALVVLNTVWPGFEKKFISRTTEAIYSAVSTVVVITINMPLLFSYELSNENSEAYVCHLKKESFLKYAWSWIELFICFCLPFGFFLVCDITLLCKRFVPRLNRQLEINVISHEHYVTDKREFPVPLIVLHMAFFICVLPCSIIEMKHGNADDKNLSLNLAFLLPYINFAYRSMLYLASNAKLKHMMKSLFQCTCNNSVEPVEDTPANHVSNVNRSVENV